MTGTTRMLVRRIAREHRRIVVPLLIALAVNVVAYAFVVYPLSQARRQHRAARGGGDPRARGGAQGARRRRAAP